VVAAAVREGRIALTHHIDVDDEAHRRVLTVTFAEAVEVRP
jgi:hypothetical protein